MKNLLSSDVMADTVLPFNGLQFIEYRPPRYIQPEGIILYLHGLGEVGKGIDAVRRNEIPGLFESGVVKPYIFLVPYLQSGTSWGKNVLLKVLDLCESYKNETGLPVVVTGISLGGIGTIDALEWAYSKFGILDYFAAAGIVCGKNQKATRDLTPFTQTPILAWHGVNDNTLPISNMRNFVKRVKDAGGNIELVEYPGVNHNAWDYAYRDGDNEFWAWLDKIIPKQEPERPKHYDGVVFQEGEEIFFKSEAGTYKLQATKQ